VSWTNSVQYIQQRPDSELSAEALTVPQGADDPRGIDLAINSHGRGVNEYDNTISGKL
jgi:hypothetical protein